MISLTYPSQQSKDVEDKLRDLIPWLTKLENTTATAGLGTSPEETAGREQFTQFASLLYPADSN